MKKAMLKNSVDFKFMFDVNIKVKSKKIEKDIITQKDIEFITQNLLKNERIIKKDDNEIVVGTDLHRTSIKKYKGFFTITECINFFASAFTQKTNYYKFLIKD